jgi:hypothetical protein
VLPSVLPSIHFGFSINYILTFSIAKTLGQRESSQANRVADEGGCIEVACLAGLYRGGRTAALDTPSTSFQALGQRVKALHLRRIT